MNKRNPRGSVSGNELIISKRGYLGGREHSLRGEPPFLCGTAYKRKATGL